MSIIKYTRRSDDLMDDDSDDKDSKRKSRNLSEKKRRDQFNVLVNELSSMVSTTSRKMDKSTVLKATISFLKNHNEHTLRSRVNEIQEDWKPTFLSNEEFTHLVLEAVDGFIIVFSTNGQIFFASESITSLLGHLPNDILGMSIYELASEDEQNKLYNTLLNPAEDDGQIEFTCHLRRGDSKQSAVYEDVHFIGYFRSDDLQTDSSRYSGYSGEADSRLLFVGTGRLQSAQLIREMPLVDSSKSEFTSRHSLEWKFLFLDHRAPPIIGYLPFELLGTSGYDYYHVDDLDRVVGCHEALMQKGEGTSCFYRFLTKGQQWIWLQTRFYITYHQWNSKPEFIVCTHRVVSYIDVKKQNRKDEGSIELLGATSPRENRTTTWNTKKIKNNEPTTMSADSPTSRHAQQSVKPREIEKLTISNVATQSNESAAPTLMEPPQNMSTMNVQPLHPSFPPLIQNQAQADLQRKHAELQAIIVHQQAELHRVSEQLLMARLGLLQSNIAQPNINVSVPGSYNIGAVSSTTTVSIPTNDSPVIIPIEAAIPYSKEQSSQAAANQRNSNTNYSSPDGETEDSG